MVRHSVCLVPHLFSASRIGRDQFTMGRVVSSCFCCNTHPTCFSHLSVFIVMCPEEIGKSSTGLDTIAYLIAFIAANYSSSSGPNFVGWYFCRSNSNEATSRAKFRENRRSIHRSTWHSSVKDLSSVMLVGSRSTRIASVVSDSISKDLGRITYPKLLIVSVKNWHFFEIESDSGVTRK